MDYKLKEWRNQPQSEHLPSAKIPRLLLEPSGSALPLFVPESNNKMANLSVFPDPATTPSRFARVGGFFSLAQWQELELQALIFKYMLAGAAVPAELIQPIEKSFLSSPACNLHQQSHHCQPAMFQSGYWGRTIVDPEPDRCRRTDGKKWRCSRDVVTGQKYCERHVHRGRNRSRKPVEIPTQATSVGALKPTSPIMALPITAVSSGINFGLSDSSPLSHLLPFNQRSSESTPGIGRTLESHIDKVSSEESADGRILRHFFDDWPRSQEEPNIANSNATPATSTTCRSISDFSLKLSTGDVDELCPQEENVGSEQNQLNWGVGWGTQQVSSMGGPLAEALRSSTTNSSPTSVLHELRHGSGSETSRIST